MNQDITMENDSQNLEIESGNAESTEQQDRRGFSASRFIQNERQNNFIETRIAALTILVPATTGFMAGAFASILSGGNTAITATAASAGAARSTYQVTKYAPEFRANEMSKIAEGGRWLQRVSERENEETQSTGASIV